MSRTESDKDARIVELETELRGVHHLLSKQLSSGRELRIETALARGLNARVSVHIGDQAVQMSPGEARETGLKLIEEAWAVQAEALLARELESIGLPLEQSGPLIHALRQRRDAERDAAAPVSAEVSSA